MAGEYFILQTGKCLKELGKKEKNMDMGNYKQKIRSSKVFGVTGNFNILTNDFIFDIKVIRINNTYNHLRRPLLILSIIGFKFLTPLIVLRHIYIHYLSQQQYYAFPSAPSSTSKLLNRLHEHNIILSGSISRGYIVMCFPIIFLDENCVSLWSFE